MDAASLHRNVVLFARQQLPMALRPGPAELSLSAHSHTSHCEIWNSTDAWFDKCAYAGVRWVLGGAAVFVLLASLLQLLPFVRLPIWARNFVKETIPDVAEHERLRLPGRSVFLSYPVGLLVLSVIGLWPSFHFWDQPLDQDNAVAVFSTWASCAIIWVCSIIYVLVFRPRTTPPALLILQILALLYSLVDPFLFKRYSTWFVAPVVSVLSIAVIFGMPMRDPRLPSHDISKPSTIPTTDLRSPEDNLTVWQWLTVSWMWPMIVQGKSRQLQFEDVWSLGHEFQHSRLHENFRLLRGSVLKRLFIANGVDCFITSALAVIETFGSVVGPVLLQKLLQSMEDPQSPKHAATIYAVLTVVAQLIVTQSDVLAMWYGRRSYERSRGELITMLYEKTLARKVIGGATGEVDENGKPEQSASAGKVLNILRGDAYEVAQRFWEWPELITRPLGLIVVFILVWNLIGWPSLLGIALVFVTQVICVFITRWLLSLERRRRGATDDKLKVITQFVEAIRHLRYNSWESKWLDGIFSERQKELVLRIKAGLVWQLQVLLNMLAGRLFPVLAFVAFTKLAGQQLRVDIAFPALYLFQKLDNDMREIPNLITTLINAWVALGRIEVFMREPEIALSDADFEDLHDKADPIEVKRVSFAWPGLPSAVLRDISLTIEPGLTVVYGKVGSGKTALLQALLGETDLLSGEYTPPHARIGYCGQTPWLQNMSIRENILFGAHLDMERYKQVLVACALTTDLASFANGDLSFVGENGIGLSGGQKARVALARAVYSNAPYLFLDDPISALDQQTAEHIIQQCVVSPLCSDRTVVLVTHRLDLVENVAQNAIEIADGQAFVRSLSELQRSAQYPNNGNIQTENGETAKHIISELSKDDPAAESGDAIKDKFIEEEKRAHGTVKFRVYWQYIKAGKLYCWAILLFVLVVFRVVDVARTWFLKAWGEGYDKQPALSVLLRDPFKELPSPQDDLTPWFIGFTVLAVALSLLHFISQLLILLITFCAAKKMFRDIMYRVSNASFRFYDVTPIGRLMNRMTSDIGVIDGGLGQQLQIVVWYFVQWIGSILVIMSVTPVFLIATVLITVAFVAIFAQFLPTSQNLRRLEMVSLSPLMANFGTLIQGLTTVRAFRAQRRFQAGVIGVVDTFQKMDHFYWSLQMWLMNRFETLSALSTFGLTLLAIYTGVSPGLTAFLLRSASQFVMSTHSLCRQYGQLELDFTSVERVVELLHIDQEPEGKLTPPAAWPTSGEIVFDHVNVRYAEHLDLVLKDINLTIPGGSNVALIGRTGSGKSTLALALLATVRPTSGTIYLDNVDICAVQPSELRRRITFLAQEPTLFVGSMRQNLDPLDEYSDAECAAVLERLSGGVRYGWTIETHVEAGGKNLSQGQRQLVQLARAILRRSPLVVLDEATASVDLGTSLEVQDILRREMVGSTVVTIAHRVEAVSNADWCIELRQGEVVRSGKPGEIVNEVDGDEY